MNANQSPNSIQFHADSPTGRAKTAGTSASRSTVVFKRSFNVGKLNEQDRTAARELLQRLMASGSLRPQT